jgi:hypothetical protein
MHAARLRYYIEGGTPPGGRKTYPGCRDHTLPRQSRPIMIDGGVYFALESKAWTGGMAFYDPDLPGKAAARGYLVTSRQLSDIATQEMYRTPDVDIPLALVVEHGRLTVGEGRYETLVSPGSLDGYPLITFTAPWRLSDVEPNSPAPAYLAMLANGLHEAHEWPADQIASYLGERPGVKGHWSAADLLKVIETGVHSRVATASDEDGNV